MSGRTDYTPEEWDLLTGLPREAAIAAAVAGAGDPLGATQAIVAAFKTLVAGSYQHPENNLIVELLMDLRTGVDGPEDEGETMEVDDEQRSQQLAETIEHGRAADAILAAKADPREAEEYRTWVLTIAQEAVRAARSGGFLGIGGTRVTETEAAFLAELRGALGIVVRR